MREKTVENK